MAIDWTLVETTLTTWAEDLTGLPASWNGSPPSPSFDDEGYLLLSITANTGLGHPELLATYNSGAAAGEEMETVQETVETFTFGIQVRTYEQSPGRDATYRANLVRAQACMPTKTGAVLDLANLAFARVLGDVPIGTIHDGRVMSVHQLDLLINTKESMADTPTGYIQTVHEASAEIPEGTQVAVVDLELP